MIYINNSKNSNKKQKNNQEDHPKFKKKSFCGKSKLKKIKLNAKSTQGIYS